MKYIAVGQITIRFLCDSRTAKAAQKEAQELLNSDYFRDQHLSIRNYPVATHLISCEPTAFLCDYCGCGKVDLKGETCADCLKEI